MASLHKDPRGKSPFWYCAFTLPNGKRTFRSTKTANRSEAQGICEKWERQSRGLAAPSKLENKELVIESFIAATQQAAQGEFSEASARKMLNDILTAAGQNPISSNTVREFLTDWLESKDVSKAKGTARRYRDIVEPFLELIGKRADLNLSGLTARDIQGFRDAELRAGKSHKTANMAVKTLRIALNAARRQGLVLLNAAEAIDNLPENSAVRGTFTPEQIGKLLAVADSEWCGMLLLGVCGGLRITDAAQLTWANLDLDRKTIRFAPRKTKGRKLRELEIPILPDLEAYLLALPVHSNRTDAPLFAKLSQKKTTGRGGLSNTFSRLIDTAGIDNEPVSDASKEGRKVYRYGFHSLRHTYVSLMANMGVAKELRMKLAGHTSNVHDRYSHLELETYRNALKDFPSFNPRK